MEVASKIINKFQTGFMVNRFIGDQGLALKIMIDNAKSTKINNKNEFEEYVGIMLDNNKAYDRVHPHYLTQVLLKFGFPFEFVRCIQNLFFDNEIYINMNGFLSNPVKQNRGLRQGDSISPLLFNFAIEPFILSIINNNNISGYTMQHTKPINQRDIQLTMPAPVKILAYADDILIFVKDRPEYMEMEECLKTYGQASNSKINYEKSVAFPLHGGKMNGYFGVRLRTYIQGKMKWYDYNCPDYIKYLGYPIYVTKQQRDVFIDELIGKIRAQVNFFKERKISVYGRANVANVMILSKLWHVLRLTPLPKSAINKLSSIIYQYIVDDKKLQVKKDVFYLHKEEGGLSLINVSAQQNTLQMRYIKSLLCYEQYKKIPKYLYDLMIYGLKTATNNPNIESIMLFENTRFKSGINNDGAFGLIMQSMDAINQQCSIANQNNVRISAMNCMTLPVSVICEMEDQFNEELIFFNSKHCKKKPGSTFLHNQLAKFTNFIQEQRRMPQSKHPSKN